MIIDINAHFGSLTGCSIDLSATALRGSMESAGIARAAASDIASAWGTDTRAASIDPDEWMIPFLSVAPDFRVERAAACKGLRGIRLYPTYQVWDFSGTAFRELLGLAEGLGLTVQVFLRLRDPRVLAQEVPSAEVVESVGKVAGARPGVRFIISGATLAEIRASIDVFRRTNIWVDSAHLQHPMNSLPKAVGLLGAENVLFGSNAPFFYAEAAVFRLRHSPLSDRDRELIQSANALRLLGSEVTK